MIEKHKIFEFCYEKWLKSTKFWSFAMKMAWEAQNTRIFEIHKKKITFNRSNDQQKVDDENHRSTHVPTDIFTQWSLLAKWLNQMKLLRLMYFRISIFIRAVNKLFFIFRYIYHLLLDKLRTIQTIQTFSCGRQNRQSVVSKLGHIWSRRRCDTRTSFSLFSFVRYEVIEQTRLFHIVDKLMVLFRLISKVHYFYIFELFVIPHESWIHGSLSIYLVNHCIWVIFTKKMPTNLPLNMHIV